MAVILDEVLQYTNARGQLSDLGVNDVGIESIEGLGDVGSEVMQSRAPYADGTRYIGSTLDVRYVIVSFIIRGTDYADVQNRRRVFASTVNPRQGLGLLEYTSGGRTWEISAVPETVPFFPDGDANRGNRWQRGSVTFVCPDPYWRDPHQESEPLQSYVGNFTLPFTLPFELGVSGSRTYLYNDGDVPAPVTIDIHGPTTNPQVINRTTGEYIRINRSIAEDEVLHIDTTSGQQRVEVRRGDEVEQAFGYLDPNGVLTEFTLELDENEIEHVADAGNANAIVIVRWQSRYAGI